MSLTRAKAVSACSSSNAASVASCRAQAAATSASQRSRLWTRATSEDNVTSFASPASPRKSRHASPKVAFQRDRNQNLHAALSGEDAARRDGRMGQADATRRLAAFVVQRRDGQPVGHHVGHRHADSGPHAGDPAGDQRLPLRRMCRGTRGHVHDRNADAGRRGSAPGDETQIRFGLDQQVTSHASGHWPVAAGTADDAGDPARTIPRRHRVREPHTPQRQDLERSRT